MRFFETETQERIGYDFYCDVANQIVKARKAKGLTVEYLAKQSKISHSRLTRIELVQVKTKLSELETIAKCLDVTVNRLIEAKIDSQIGDCLYLIWPEFCPDFKLYQKATSKRMAFLIYEKQLNESGVRPNSPRERVFVKLVGVPVTEQEIKDHFPKLTSDEEEVYPD